jgi:hypothetical protein
MISSMNHVVHRSAGAIFTGTDGPALDVSIAQHLDLLEEQARHLILFDAFDLMPVPYRAESGRRRCRGYELGNRLANPKPRPLSRQNVAAL